MPRNLLRGLFALILFAGALGLSACNTVHGMGEDISSAATAVKNAF